MSDHTNTSTPRTDAVIQSPYHYPAGTEKNAVVILCRQLERELAAVTAERDELKQQIDQLDDERLAWKREAELRGEALAERRMRS